jgi:serpin B
MTRPKQFLLIVMTLALLTVATLPACAPTPAPAVAASDRPRQRNPDVPEATLRRLVAGNNLFALDLYHALRQEEEGNLFYSPYSIVVALAMTYAGAQGETERQMVETLHFDLPPEILHPALNDLDQRLAAPPTGENFYLVIANSTWVQEGFPWRDEYLDTLAVHYGAGLYLVDFTEAARREQARQAINRWVKEQTQSKIGELLGPAILDAQTRLVLANAIYFQGEWSVPFTASAVDGQFHLLDGRTVTVPLMSRRAATGMTAGSGYQVLELAYKGDRVHMIILLPDEGRFEEIEQVLRAGQLEAMVAALQPTDLMLYLPKFSFDAEFNLRSALAGMGMPDAFDRDAADFSGIYDRSPGGGNLYVSHVIHKAFVVVDEQGTEAAAATSVVFRQVSAGLNQITVDRPFLFFIRDLETGAILFVGRVVDPS